MNRELMRNFTSHYRPSLPLYVYWTYIETDSVQVHLCEFYVFVLFSSLSTLSQEKSIGHPPLQHGDNNQQKRNNRYRSRHVINLHYIGLVNSGHAGPLIIPGILKGILSDAFTGLLCNELDTLHNTINNLKECWTEENCYYYYFLTIFYTIRKCVEGAGSLTTCSIPLYSPSVFSLMVTRFTSV